MTDTTTLERVLAATPAEQIAAAKEELTFEKLWIKSGSPDPAPFLPNLQAIRDRSAARQTNGGKMTNTTTTTTRGRTSETAGLRLFHDGKPQPDNQNKLSTIAYDYTKGIEGDTPRIPVAKLREVLATLGVTDTGKPFDVTLPNGVRLEARAEGVAATSTPPAPAAKDAPAPVVESSVVEDPHNDPVDPDLEAKLAASAAKKEARNAKRRADRAAKRNAAA